MASMSMTASLLPVSSSGLTRLSSRPVRRGVIVAKAVSTDQGGLETKQESSHGRRDLIFSAAAAGVLCFANVAMGEEEPKRGTPEAKKKYFPICVTMPTASVCRKQKRKLDEMYDQLRSEYQSMKRSAFQPANNFFTRNEPDLFSNPAVNMMNNKDPI